MQELCLYCTCTIIVRVAVRIYRYGEFPRWTTRTVCKPTAICKLVPNITCTVQYSCWYSYNTCTVYRYSPVLNTYRQGKAIPVRTGILFLRVQVCSVSPIAKTGTYLYCTSTSTCTVPVLVIYFNESCWSMQMLGV